MTSLETAVVELVKLGLDGDSLALRRYARRLLRHANHSDTTPDYREALAKLVVDHVADGPRPRWARAEDVPREGGNFLRVERRIEANAPVLSPAVQAVFDSLVRERERAEDLKAAGVEPTRTLLVVGAPGVGKTMMVRSLARQLDLPLLTIDLAILMSSFLGKSGQNLRQALEFARSEPCVLFLDEFDALAKRRDDPSDVGELKRIVNVLLLELDSWPSSGLLTAATNHPELLDKAIWRRFERTISIDLPDADARYEILRQVLTQHGRTISASTLSRCVAMTVGTSGSDIVTLARQAVRDSVIHPADSLDSLLASVFLERLRSAALSDRNTRSLYSTVAHELGHSFREIGAVLGISHVTVGKLMMPRNSMKKTTPGAKRSRRPPDGARARQEN